VSSELLGYYAKFPVFFKLFFRRKVHIFLQILTFPKCKKNIIVLRFFRPLLTRPFNFPFLSSSKSPPEFCPTWFSLITFPLSSIPHSPFDSPLRPEKNEIEIERGGGGGTRVPNLPLLSLTWGY
jgi:hypothetical protein